MKLNLKTVCVALAVIICVFSIARVTIIIIEGEKGRLKRTIYKAKRHTERENILGLTGYISREYSDELGNDKQTLLLIAKTFFKEYRNILILIDALEIAIDENDATTNIEATVYWQEKSSENIIYDTLKVKARFKKEERHWRLIELEFFEPEKKRLFSPMMG